VKLRPIEPTPLPTIVGCAYTTSSASTVAAQRFLTIVRTVAADRAHRLPRFPFRKVRQIWVKLKGRTANRLAIALAPRRSSDGP
jgi:hypothetical protein